MKKEFRKGAQEARATIFAELESTYHLDNYVRAVLANPDQDYCGVLISGHKGSGKTFFVENYLRKFERSHPILIARHYQQHVKIPYFGFKYCISDYLSKIYNQFSEKEFHRFSVSLKDYLGDSFPLLLDYIPELLLITSEVSGPSSRSMLTIENQLYPLFKRLFEFLADYSGNTVFFFTDDLQWIDASGTNLLKYLLLNLSPGKLVWIGACRSPQNNISSLRQLDEELGLKKRRIENISLTGLNMNEVQRFVEMSLRGNCHPDLIEVCFKLSGGNPSHLQVLLESLQDSGFLSLENGIWNCDRSAVVAQYAGQKTEGMLLENARKLSDAAWEVLCIMACMGRFNRRTVLDWLKGDAKHLDRLLKDASDAGIITVGKNDIHFSDMHIGEMIYDALPAEKRLSFHYDIGTLFYARGLEFLSATELILMTLNFNQALDMLKAEGKIQMIADLNYRAGKISQQENALEQARYFFKMSAELLKECPWDEVFEQVWLVYIERARVEYYLGEYDLAEIHLDYLLERNPDPMRRAKAFELKVTINNHLGRYRKVVRILKESLSELGLELPLNENVLMQEVKLLTNILSKHEQAGEGKSPERQLHPDTREAILRLLYVGGMGLHHTSDVLMRWAALQIIICSGKESTSGVKAIGCVSYGRMLIISGDIEKGYEFGLKGLAINQELQDFTLGCRVYGVYAFYIQPWKKAFAESYGYLDKAAMAGKKSGDLIGLYILKTHRLNLHLISGLPLQELLHWDFEESYPGRELTYYITHYQMSLLKFLAGESAVFTMPRQQPSWLAAELTIQEEKFYRNYVWARYYFLFGHYELAAWSAEEADNNRKLQEGSPLLPANLFTWFLSMTQNWEYYSDGMAKKMEVRIREILRSFELWQAQAPDNYLPSWYLLSAEWARVKGDYKKALEYYQLSAEASISNLFHLAITHELWARHLLAVPGEQAQACFHLSEAIRAYNEWGGVAKSQQLLRQYQAVLSEIYPVQGKMEQEMDMETIQYELSGDMEVPSLVKKLMVLLLRITGSTHVVVELVKDTGDRILFDNLSLLNSPAGTFDVATENISIPVSLILMSLKSQNTIVVNDLRSEKNFRDLEVIQDRGVQSFLILPVTINGHLSMVTYLENIWAENWYVPSRIRWARITANQGAVIIENARIHERSVKLNSDLRKEMAEKERLASVIEAQKDAHLKALVQTQDSERKRIASDLHDSLGSLLSTVKLRFNGLQTDFEARVPEKLGRFSDTIRMLDEAIHELRQISHNMLPVSLSRFGLKAALETFVEQINSSRQLETKLQILGLERRLSEDMEVAVYRICQELVQNVIKHSGATSLSIQLIDHQDSLNIIVEDNGIGIRDRDLTRGFGFTTIQSKVNLFKGSFEIDSKPGKGAMVLVDLPVGG
jgi:signal transduction histidine kinase/predicted ATPase